VAEMLSLAKFAHASASAPFALGCCHRQLQRTRVRSDRGLLTRGPLPETLGLELGYGYGPGRTARPP
jgi:hypothetical protein